jgi:hypothetical protein
MLGLVAWIVFDRLAFRSIKIFQYNYYNGLFLELITRTRTVGEGEAYGS